MGTTRRPARLQESPLFRPASSGRAVHCLRSRPARRARLGVSLLRGLVLPGRFDRHRDVTSNQPFLERGGFFDATLDDALGWLGTKAGESSEDRGAVNVALLGDVVEVVKSVVEYRNPYRKLARER